MNQQEKESFIISFKDKPYHVVFDHLLDFCEKGQLEYLDFLMTSPDIEIKPSVNGADGKPLTLAIKNNQFEVVKYLLTSPKLKEHANIELDREYNAINACKYNVEMIEFLTTSPLLEKKLTVSVKDNAVLQNAACFGQLEVVKFLLTDERVKDQTNFYDCHREVLLWCLSYNHVDILEFLVCDYQIQKTPDVEKLIQNEEKNRLKTLFDKRELFYDLNKLNHIQQEKTKNKNINNKPSTRWFIIT